MIKVSDIFQVNYGVNLELNALKQTLALEGINFVSRTSKNNGVSARVERLTDVEPIPAGTISVAGGGSVMESFLQPEQYYSGRDLYYLTPLIDLSEKEKLYYCACLRANKYRFNYGRQANRTLSDLLIPAPDQLPKWISQNENEQIKSIRDKFQNQEPSDLKIGNWKWFEYQDLFDIERGRGPRKNDLKCGNTPFITSTDQNNGITGFTSSSPMHDGNSIGVNRNGSVGQAFYQPLSFCSTEDVHVFVPKFKLNKYIALFFVTLIRQEKYRFGYGRKWGISRMKTSKIKLPMKADGKPDFEFMENYIKSLPYSKSL